MLSPESIRTPSIGVVWGNTIRAPVFSFDIAIQASTISVMSLSARCLSFMANNLDLAPILVRKWRISGWKMIMSARTPTSITVPIREDIIFIPSESTINLKITISTIAMNMLKAEESFIHLYPKYRIKATRRISIISVRERLMNPRISRSIICKYNIFLTWTVPVTIQNFAKCLNIEKLVVYLQPAKV